MPTPSIDDLWMPGGSKPQSPADGGISTEIDLYDSDLLKIEACAKALQRHVNKPGDLGNIQDEITERFGLAGYKVDVAWWVTEEPGPLGPAGMMIPAITIQGRIDKPDEFDHDKMQYEVQSNLLGIDEQPGAMTKDGTIKSPSKSVSMSTKAEKKG